MARAISFLAAGRVWAHDRRGARGKGLVSADPVLDRHAAGLPGFEQSHAEAHFHLATVLARSERFEDSLTHLCTAARLAPSNAAVWRNLGVCLAQLERLRLRDAPSTPP